MLKTTSTAPVGESMPTASGGSDVLAAIHTPAMQLPISIAQIAVGMPAARSPGNISAPNETMLPISTTAAIRPAIVSLRRLRAAPAHRGRPPGATAMSAAPASPCVVMSVLGCVFQKEGVTGAGRGLVYGNSATCSSPVTSG